jgi:hypothetical protein
MTAVTAQAVASADMCPTPAVFFGIAVNMIRGAAQSQYSVPIYITFPSEKLVH